MAPFARPPTDWRFSDPERDKYSKRHWQCPVRLIVNADGSPGVWASLWRDTGTLRGGGGIASVLPVLALHTWPGKTLGADPGERAWTAWTYLSFRRIGRLAGTGKHTVGQVLRSLEARGLLQLRRTPPPEGWGGPGRLEYRLSVSLYRQGDAEYVTLPGMLFYGGHWNLLPLPSARQLYVTLACVQPVRDEDAWVTARGLEPRSLDAAVAVQEALEAHPLSLAKLATLSGMRRSTVEEALSVLLTPQFQPKPKEGEPAPEKLGYIASGPADHGMRWFCVESEPQRWFWDAEFLNKPAVAVDADRRRLWPQLVRTPPKRRKRRRAA